MTKVVGVFTFQPKSGVAAADLERFLIEEMSQAPCMSGTSAQFFKSDRGEHNGTYAMHLAIESVATRDRYWPNPGENSDELNHWWVDHGAIWDRFFAMAEAISWNDYVELRN
jgi:hypothetical protein